MRSPWLGAAWDSAEEALSDPLLTIHFLIGYFLLMSSNLKLKALPGGLSDSDIAQLQVLKALYEANPSGNAGKCLDVDDIAVKSGVTDDKEALRCLYILEGQRLVSPTPAGDLTSREWHITLLGIRAVQKFGL